MIESSRFRWVLSVWLLAASACVAESPDGRAELLASWQWYQEIQLPPDGKSGPCEFRLTPKALDGARSDLQDLRLFDAGGREVPYALRVRLPRDETRTIAIREFNRVSHPDRSVEVSLDLGDEPGEHNRIEVATGGVNYRRFLHIEGSDDNKTWKPMLDKRLLTYLTHEGMTFDGRQVSYATSRYRYLRIRVYPDPAVEADAPAAPQVRVLRGAQSPALELPWPAELSYRNAVRDQGDYASEWFISLPGKEMVPWLRIELDADESEFTRTYRVENADDAPQGYRQSLAQGEWHRGAGKKEPLTIVFSPEATARRLRLIIVDQRNPPLTVKLVKATAAARQMIFDRPADATSPWRLYYGNPNAPNPGYDYARRLPDRFETDPPTAQPGAVAANPTYKPPRIPLTERSPAVTYGVFGIVALILLAILALLARKAIAAHDAVEQAAAASAASQPNA
jgi:Protein of unknown function (DUF3999)